MPTHRSTARSATSAAALLALFAAAAPPAHADVFQWEYVNPANPTLGKRESSILAPGGAGANAERGADLAGRNLTMAYLIGADLSPHIAYDEYGYISSYVRADLTGTNLRTADLTDASFAAATLTGANFTGAVVRGANFNTDVFEQYGLQFGYGTGLTVAQLTSTASYQAHDLVGINLNQNDLTGVNLAGQNLTDARLAGAKLANADFRSANLTNAAVSGVLTGANFTDAVIRGAGIYGMTKAQIYSTASYKAKDLSGIWLTGSNLTGWDLAGQNLTGANLYNDNLTKANLSGADLSNATASYATLTDTDFRQADLTGAVLQYSKLTGANFTGARVRGTDFSADTYFYPGSGLTPAQLGSTASYAARDLTGIILRGNALTGANLAGQNLSGADFTMATLTGANLSDAVVTSTNFKRDLSRDLGGITAAQLYSTASYQVRDLSGIGLGFNNLAGANLEGQNLADANFVFATLTDADFRHANLTGALFGEGDYGADLTRADLSHANLTNASLVNSTLANARLVGANLTGAALTLATLTNADLREADLTGANLAGFFVVVSGEEGGYYHFPGANLTGANLSGANLTGADFSGTDDYVFGFPHPGANFTNANLSGADARGANFKYATMTGANTSNLIQPDGHIAGLDLTSGASLVVRDYDGGTTIRVEDRLLTDPTGSLRLVFDADGWGSTISFAPGIPVTRDGTLELAFAPGVNLADQHGRTIDLFDWTGVTPTGAFDVESPHLWDLSDLYTTGEVALLARVGDANADGRVNADDYFLIDSAFLAGAPSDGWHDGDFNADGRINADDYFLIDAAFLGQGAPLIGRGDPSPLFATAVPQPALLPLLLPTLLLLRRRASRR
jgi:uncharacterized protein YjbI with pentapeptide repeats